MDSFNLNLDQITQETFELGEQISFSHFDINENRLEDSHQQVQQETLEQDVLPQNPGLVYKIEKTQGTFCIRALVSSNIFETFEKLYNHDLDSLNKLKVGEFIRDDFFYFETCTVERAEMVFDQIVNRRFPIDEDALCNISDPGFSWWMNIGEGSFQIHFNSHGLNRAERFIRLGPLGDEVIAASRFIKLEEHLTKHFPISEMSINNKGIKIITAALDNKAFYHFQSMFTDGVNDTRYSDFANTSSAKTLFLYLKELCDIRLFWLNIEDKIYQEFS